jgi:hypothetical protein
MYFTGTISFGFYYYHQGNILIPILQMGKLRLKQTLYLAHD